MSRSVICAIVVFAALAAGSSVFVPSCPVGSSLQEFSDVMFACGGTVDFADRTKLCTAPGSHVCSAAEYVSQQSLAAAAPTNHYWVDDYLGYGGSESDCYVDVPDDDDTDYYVYDFDLNIGGCGADTPMRVCAPNNDDSFGNQCNWFNCAWTSNGTDNFYFGGCEGNYHAGALCCFDPLVSAINAFASVVTACAGGRDDQQFFGYNALAGGGGSGDDSILPEGYAIFGCAGSVEKADRLSLCAEGFYSCSLGEYEVVQSQYANAIEPSAHYWSDDDASLVGTEDNCYLDPIANATSSVGCAKGGARVCAANHTDSEMNECSWANCGSAWSESNHYFGGCGDDLEAGALCCIDAASWTGETSSSTGAVESSTGDGGDDDPSSAGSVTASVVGRLLAAVAMQWALRACTV